MESRLKSMLVYSFSNPYEEPFGSRIRLMEGDITNCSKVEELSRYEFKWVINCAACVKHFSADDTLEQVHDRGVCNFTRLCRETGRELIQMGDVSELMNASGMPIAVASDEEFQQAFDNEEKNELIADLIAYASSAQETSTVYMNVDNSFLIKAFYRLGFQWPMSDNTYLKHALQTLEILGFFDGKI